MLYLDPAISVIDVFYGFRYKVIFGVHVETILSIFTEPHCILSCQMGVERIYR